MEETAGSVAEVTSEGVAGESQADPTGSSDLLSSESVGGSVSELWRWS